MGEVRLGGSGQFCAGSDFGSQQTFSKLNSSAKRSFLNKLDSSASQSPSPVLMFCYIQIPHYSSQLHPFGMGGPDSALVVGAISVSFVEVGGLHPLQFSSHAQLDLHVLPSLLLHVIFL